MWNDASGSSSSSAAPSTDANALGIRERAVGDRMQVREVDHGTDPVEACGEPEDVLRGAELPNTAHHLDSERDRSPLGHEPLAELGELLRHGLERLLPRPSEQEPRVDDDDLGAAGHRDAGRVVEHPRRPLVLHVPLEMAEKGWNRGVHRERDLPGRRQPAELLRPVLVHPEAAREVDLARRVPALCEHSTAASGLSRLGTRAGPMVIVDMDGA